MPPVSLIVSRGGAEPSDADGDDEDAITADLLQCESATNESSDGAMWEWGECVGSDRPMLRDEKERAN